VFQKNRIMRRQKETYFDELGPRFKEVASDYDAAARSSMLARMLKDAGRPTFSLALEVGCGFGAVTSDVKQYSDRLVTLDIGENLVRLVGAEQGTDGLVANALELPFANDTFDFVVSSEVIEHTPDPLVAAQQLLRVTKPGGYLAVTSPNPLWGPLVRLTTLLGLREFEGNEIFVSASSILKGFGTNIEMTPALRGCHLFPWQIPMSKPLLRRLDQFGRLLRPIMINWGFLVQKKI
jgi:SAM-dependent methyltransferase